VLRLALTPRWLAAALGLLLAVTVCLVAGRWQWQRTQDVLAAERAAVAAAVPIEQVIAPGSTDVPAESIGRPVTLSGSYDPAYQSIVPNRVDDGVAGVWVVTGLRLGDGSVVAVLRGSLASADAAGARVPSGPVQVEGVIQPDESFYADAADEPGKVAAVVGSRLSAQWGTDVLPGHIALVSQSPADPPAPTPVEASVQTADVPFPAQNFFYALQWWIFGLFAIVVYLRWLWLESRREDEPVSS
jgi:cytochrome oxidase assembly protein ShyY1